MMKMGGRIAGRQLAPLCTGVLLLGASACSVVGGARGNRFRAAGAVLTGQAALGDWTTDAPGVRRKITAADLPAPYATPSVDRGAKMVPRPADAWPQAPQGFTVTLLATGLENPRAVITAPNGDLFISESRPNRIRVLRDADHDEKVESNTVFAKDLALPFGMAFYPPGPNPTHLYVANTDRVIRFPYRNGDVEARGASETIVPDIPGFGQLRGGGHWTRDLALTRDGKKLYVSVGSLSNADDGPKEARRASILQYNPDGSGYRLFASGIRNPVGLAVHPETGKVWTSVNERDELGDHLVPDYITSVKEGGFYGWPWYYLGPNQDPRHAGKHPELRDKVVVPDVLLQSHSASLDLAFYTGGQFPKDYRNEIFAAEHGSWNRSRRTGYKIVRVPLKNGQATGEYEDFVTGFVTAEGNVWGRPVGVTTGRDGSLVFTDDGGNCVWKATYGSKSAAGPHPAGDRKIASAKD